MDAGRCLRRENAQLSHCTSGLYGSLGSLARTIALKHVALSNTTLLHRCWHRPRFLDMFLQLLRITCPTLVWQPQKGRSGSSSVEVPGNVPSGDHKEESKKKVEKMRKGRFGEATPPKVKQEVKEEKHAVTQEVQFQVNPGWP